MFLPDLLLWSKLHTVERETAACLVHRCSAAQIIGRKGVRPMAAETKVSVTYEHTDGSKETRSISNLNPEATNEVLLNMMNQFTGLQDEAVKMVKAVKRVDSTSLM